MAKKKKESALQDFLLQQMGGADAVMEKFCASQVKKTLLSATDLTILDVIERIQAMGKEEGWIEQFQEMTFDQFVQLAPDRLKKKVSARQKFSDELAQIRTFLKSKGSDGASHNEVVAATGIDGETVSQRLHYLKKFNDVKSTGKHRHKVYTWIGR